MEPKKKTSAMHQLVSFMLDRETFAMDVMKIQGIERMTDITKIPGMPEFVEGVINLRDLIIPIVDLRRRFRLKEKEQDKEIRIVLAELEAGFVIGMIVDQVNEVFQIEPDALRDVPRVVGGGAGGINREFIRGVAKKEDSLVIVLDVEKIFSEEEAQAMKSVR